MEGTWEFSLTKDNNTKEIVEKCSVFNPPPMEIVSRMKIMIESPNKSTDVDTGKEGTWTTVYDQGIDILINGKR